MSSKDTYVAFQPVLTACTGKGCENEIYQRSYSEGPTLGRMYKCHECAAKEHHRKRLIAFNEQLERQAGARRRELLAMR